MVPLDRNSGSADFDVVGAKHFALSLWPWMASAEKQRSRRRAFGDHYWPLQSLGFHRQLWPGWSGRGALGNDDE